MFHFFGLKLASMQALFHCYQPLPNFFSQMMHFYKSIWENFIKNVFEASKNYLITSGILAILGKNMPKTCSLKTLLHA
jgi:hypothetical protein